MIYGANGYTGRLVAREAKRQGLSPIVAGRDAAAIKELADELVLPWRAFSLMDTSATRHALADVAVVANCAGPFSATSAPMIAACLESRTHYVDITGEIDVFIAAERLHAKARAAGIVVCPGVGFDVIPTDCVAVCLLEALPDARFIALGFRSAAAQSPGTARTSVEGAARGGRVRKDGAIIAVPLAHRTRTIDFGTGPKLAMAIPWGDVATAYFSTGIPNVETYIAASPSAVARMRRMNWVRPLLRVPFLQALVQRRAARANPGPSQKQRDADKMYVWGEARNDRGETRTARVTTSNGYRLTVDGVLMAVRTLLTHASEGGYRTPTQLMGPRCVERLPGCSAIRVEAG
ncbi:MAG TPA: saccharopine dehydrogenase NADP-binding domain-containing protein [Casimicrobiaceae bacterium]